MVATVVAAAAIPSAELAAELAAVTAKLLAAAAALPKAAVLAAAAAMPTNAKLAAVLAAAAAMPTDSELAAVLAVAAAMPTDSEVALARTPTAMAVVAVAVVMARNRRCKMFLNRAAPAAAADVPIFPHARCNNSAPMDRSRDVPNLRNQDTSNCCSYFSTSPAPSSILLEQRCHEQASYTIGFELGKTSTPVSSLIDTWLLTFSSHRERCMGRFCNHKPQRSTSDGNMSGQYTSVTVGTPELPGTLPQHPADCRGTCGIR